MYIVVGVEEELEVVDTPLVVQQVDNVVVDVEHIELEQVAFAVDDAVEVAAEEVVEHIVHFVGIVDPPFPSISSSS